MKININENNLKHQGRGAESERGDRAWLQVHHVEAGEPGQVLCQLFIKYFRFMLRSFLIYVVTECLCEESSLKTGKPVSEKNTMTVDMRCPAMTRCPAIES